jgi:hypothetical protein
MSYHLITVSDAADMTSRFRSNKESILVDAYQNTGVLPICETFDRAAFDLLLADTNCTGVRIYLGMDSNSKVVLIFAGVNSSSEDLVISSLNPANSLAANCVFELGIRCPTVCPPSSALNS